MKVVSIITKYWWSLWKWVESGEGGRRVFPLCKPQAQESSDLEVALGSRKIQFVSRVSALSLSHTHSPKTIVFLNNLKARVSFWLHKQNELSFLFCKERMICEKYFNYFKSLNLMIIFIFYIKFEYKCNILKSTQPHIMHLCFPHWCAL